MTTMPVPSDHFSTNTEQYRLFRPRYPEALFEWLATISPATEHAWDCGCGNGQASVGLARHFARVTATDVSAEQIKQALQADNVSYQHSPAETIAADAASLDLIAVAQAIHWFDHRSFFTEVERTLKPNGILAAWGYQLLYSDTVLDEFIVHFHSEIVGPYWPAGRELLDGNYARIEFPYPRLKTPPLRMEVSWTFEQFEGYLNTWSAVKYYIQHHRQNPVSLHRQELLSLWGGEDEKNIYWPLLIYAGRKPAAR